MVERLRDVRLVLGAVGVGLAIHLLLGDKPWEGKTAELLRQGKPVYFLNLAPFYRYWITAGNLLVVALLWWSAPRNTWVMPISWSSTQLARKNVGLPSARATTKSSRLAWSKATSPRIRSLQAVEPSAGTLKRTARPSPCWRPSLFPAR